MDPARRPNDGTQGTGDTPCALVLGGGGALAAYQVGVLSWVAEHSGCIPTIITGVSAGSINAAALADYRGSFQQRTSQLRRAWGKLTADKVFRVDAMSLVGRILGWGVRLLSGGGVPGPRPRGMVDTAPLHNFLREHFAAPDGRLNGIAANLEEGVLEAVAVTASSHATEQSVTWVEGRQPEGWNRAHRVGYPARLTVDHVMASAALPLLFPAVQVEGAWYCDGSVRLTSPLSPAIHLGADRVFAISTRFPRINEPTCPVDAYPSPAVVAGDLLDALFLDVFDGDALRVERINDLISELPADRSHGMRRVELLVQRPSRDLTRLASEYEARLPWPFRFLTRGLGTREARSNALLSLLMFQPDYIERLVGLGYDDANARGAELKLFFGQKGTP